MILLTSYHRRRLSFVFILFCLSVFFVTPDYGQTNNTIHSIDIHGNKRTKTTFLQRFVYTKPGNQYDSIQINDDLRRLRTLAPVMDAEVNTTHNDSGIVVHYKITERLTIFPVGDFGITQDNFWIGAGVMESNLAGRGMYIYGFYRYNVDHTIHFIFRNPYINGSKWGFELQMKNLPTTESLKTDSLLKYQHSDFSLALKYEFRYENDLYLGTTFRYQAAKYEFENEEYIETKSIGFRRSLVPFLRWEIQNLDVRHFYIQGWKNNLYLEVALPLRAENSSVLLFYDEFRMYRRFGNKGNLAIRMLAGLSNEEYTAFSPFIADSYYNFRGIGYRAYKGNITGLINLEYRQTVFENHFGGIQAVAFCDAGVLLNSDHYTHELSPEESIHTFGGLGARFVFRKAYNAIFSIDYGVNLQNIQNGGWVIGWGQYF